MLPWSSAVNESTQYAREHRAASLETAQLLTICGHLCCLRGYFPARFGHNGINKGGNSIPFTSPCPWALNFAKQPWRYAKRDLTSALGFVCSNVREDMEEWLFTGWKIFLRNRGGEYPARTPHSLCKTPDPPRPVFHKDHSLLLQPISHVDQTPRGLQFTSHEPDSPHSYGAGGRHHSIASIDACAI